MNSDDGSRSNVPGGSPPQTSPHPDPDPLFSDARAAKYGAVASPPGLLRRTAGHWPKILFLWLAVSTPIIFGIYRWVEPTYEAVSTLLVEPLQTNMYEAIRHEHVEYGTDLPYLRTQANLLVSDQVLNDAIVDASVVNLPVITKSKDANADLKKDLSVKIIDEAYLIRVGLELPDGDQAAKIVNAVVSSYLKYHTEYQGDVNSALRSELNRHLKFIEDELKNKQAELHAYYAKGAVEAQKATLNANSLKGDGGSPQPTLSSITPEQYDKLVESLVQCDLEYLAAVARLDAVKVGLERNHDEIESQLEARIAEKFREDSDVVAIKERISAVREEVEKLKIADKAESKPHAPATRKQLDELQKEYEKLWQDRHNSVRDRLISEDQGLFSQAKIQELEADVESASKKKLAYARYAEQMAAQRKWANHDTFEATLLDYQIKSLLKKQEQVSANLSQLAFDDRQETYRIQKVDAATVPKTPTHNDHINYMLIATASIFVLFLSYFLMHEMKAGRAARYAG
jgi:hypothetical protein